MERRWFVTFRSPLDGQLIATMGPFWFRCQAAWACRNYVIASATFLVKMEKSPSRMYG